MIWFPGIFIKYYKYHLITKGIRLRAANGVGKITEGEGILGYKTKSVRVL